MSNADMTVDIINVIRRYAVGASLLNHEDRIKQAVAKLKANHSFDPIELGWLKMIEANLLQENVLDESVFDKEVIFRNKGGFKRIDKDFKFQLRSLIAELNKYLYDDAA
jgi:type I restriction enzyme R subunit